MSMTETRFRVGGQVRVDSPKYPGLWTIIKVNPKTLKLEQGWTRLNCDKGYALPADADASVVSPNNVGRTLPMQTPGAVVRYRGTKSGEIKAGDLVVVIADKGERINIAPVGGFTNGTQYLRASHRNIEAVDPATWVVVEG